MNIFFRFAVGLVLTVLLASCASTEKRDGIASEPAQSEAGNYKYDAWRPDAGGEYGAINELVNEADVLIKKKAFDAATDKLERVLRIKPEYAPAWSRLSWLALQVDAPKRAVQMAKRSNSFAFSDPELLSLNWSFIRAASKALNDEEAYFRANQKMEFLKIF